MNTHIGKRPFWFRRTREARRVIELAQELKFPTHRKNTALVAARNARQGN